jgi:nucleolar complex protein 3
MPGMAQYPSAKRRRLSPPESENTNGATKAGHSEQQFYKRAAQWNLEQDYEQRPRKNKSKENGRLPIKTADGWVEQTKVAAPADDDADSFLDSGDEEASSDEEVVGQQAEESKLSTRQQIFQAKEDLAKFASLVNEDPEEHLGSLKAIAQIAASKNTVIKKLALATQCAVYQDLIPGYRIRPASDEELTAKLSKDVRKLRSYEQALVGGYQLYVKELEKLVKGGKQSSNSEVAGLASVALSCACKLVLAVPHFNFRGELLQLIVSKLSGRKVDGDFQTCLQTIETLFRDDDDGHPSLDAVTLLTKMIKGKNYSVHENVLNTFLQLRLLSEFSYKGSHESIDKLDDPDAVPDKRKVKQKREFRTKKERKMLKERKIVEKEMKEADAEVSHEERDRQQSEMLKLVFATYFRILKNKIAHLNGAVLEGLARYAHLINQDFFGDILEALKDLIQSAVATDEDEEEDAEEQEDGTRNPTRESLLCVVTAFALLQGQDVTKSATTLHLDLKFFITHLYRTLYPAALNADIELGPKSFHLPDPLAATPPTATANKVNAQTTTVLLIRCLSSVLLPATAVRAVPPLRIAAFTKQLLTASMHLPEKSCLAMLGLLTSTTKVHGRKVAALWNTEERRGDGVFDPLRGEVEGSNPFAATVWEGEILRLHFCPKVRDAMKGVEKNVVNVH